MIGVATKVSGADGLLEQTFQSDSRNPLFGDPTGAAREDMNDLKL
jgi:hypothetical protein